MEGKRALLIMSLNLVGKKKKTFPNTQELNVCRNLHGTFISRIFFLIPEGRREGSARRQERVQEAMLWEKTRILNGSGHAKSSSCSFPIAQASLRFTILLSRPLKGVIVNTDCQIARPRITMKTNLRGHLYWIHWGRKIYHGRHHSLGWSLRLLPCRDGLYP